MDADGVSHVVRAPPLSEGARTFAVTLPVDASWGDPPNEFSPGEMPRLDPLGPLLLSNWVVDRVDGFLSTLGAWLPRVQEGAFLASLLEQCTDAARSLARVGVDFSLLARVAFRDAILRLLDEGSDRKCLWILPL